MKFKYLALLSLGAVAFVGCSDDNDTKYNTKAGVTVELKETSIRISEDQISNTSYNYIPVVVNGETNGAVQVTIEVVPYGESPAQADVNYIVTSYTINIPAGQTEGQFQYYPKGDDIINDDRSFEVKIKSVTGAAVGANNSTVVTLVDNEGLIPIYYDGLAGFWDVVYDSAYDGLFEGYPVEFVTVAEGEAGYGSDLTIYDFPDAGFVTNAKFSVDGVEQVIYVTVPMGQTIGSLSHPTYGVGPVILYPCDGTYYTTSAYEFTFKFNFDLKTGAMVPDSEWDFSIFVSFSAGMMIYDRFSGIEFYR